MKIVEVRTYSPVYPVKDPFSNALRTTRERAFGIVEVITDAGITGWGEARRYPRGARSTPTSSAAIRSTTR
jgi:D-galactarolactone cycloisomerase